jgi:hypothetical protein
MIDGRATGPEFEVEFPFRITSVEGLRDAQQALNIAENRIIFNQRFEGDGYAWVELFGYGTGAGDHGFTVFNREAGTGVQVKVDKPVYRMTFWATNSTLCPENYLSLTLEPGSSESWQSAYTLLLE